MTTEVFLTTPDGPREYASERESGTDVVPHTNDVGIIYADGFNLEEIESLEPKFREVASQLQVWINDQRSKPGPLTRPEFEKAKDVFAEMAVAKQIAEEDDTVSSFLEVVEGLVFQGMKWEHEDPLTTDLFNQMAAEQNLDALLRKMWRELDEANQAVMASNWETKSLKVRGKTENGNAKKTTKSVNFPAEISVLDNQKILPVEMDAFGGERLAYRASPIEYELYGKFLKGERQDAAMSTFYVSKYELNPAEREELAAYSERLILLNPELVKRHTNTKGDYKRWAPVRLKSIFRFIDMKLQLMQADRVALVGAANYILLVKKGDKDNPAKTEEIENLRAGFRTLAKVPVIFSDHRLEIEIITPKQDYTLDPKKYALIEAQIVQRLLNSLPNSSAAGAFKTELGRSTQLALQNRRHMLKRFLEKEIARKVVEKNPDVFDKGAPSLVFVPAQIQVGDIGAIAQQVMALRTMKDLSRESALEFFGFDQGAEAMRRKIEELLYDDTFQTAVPFSAANGAPPAAEGQNGPQGGRPQGGGDPAKNATKPANSNDRGNTSSGTRKRTTT